MNCVRIHESHNGADPKAHGNIYGMISPHGGWDDVGGLGFAGDHSRAEQNYRAWLLWRKYGMSPWCQYDGCCHI